MIFQPLRQITDIRSMEPAIAAEWSASTERCSMSSSAKAFREKFYDSVEELQNDLDEYLRFYNTECSHQGCRNVRKRPVDTVERFVKSSRKKVG